VDSTVKEDRVESSFDAGQAGRTDARQAGENAMSHPAPSQTAPRRHLRSVILRALGELAVTAGALVLLFLGWQLWWTDVAADREQAATVTALRQEWRHRGTGSPAPAPAQPGAMSAVPEVRQAQPGEVFGVLRVPRWGEDYARPLVEGIEQEQLQRGVGHYEGTALPGAVGNFATAGHRTTYGKPYNGIDELQVGDEVFVDTEVATFVYRVRGWEIVTPDRIDMVAPVPGHPDQVPVERLMTFTACHPEFSAKYRWITIAVLARTLPAVTA
jgi:sortase A